MTGALPEINPDSDSFLDRDSTGALLECVYGNLQPAWPNPVPLNSGSIVIGRIPPAGILIDSPQVSRQHSRIDRTAHGYTIVDLGSRNGTFVNGEAVGPAPRELRPGDDIVLAGVAGFRFHDAAETAPAPRVGRVRGVWLDEVTRDVWVDARRVDPDLSIAQFDLLRLLYARAGQVIWRAEIVPSVWPGQDAAGITDDAIDGVIKRLRGRLRETAHGVDYLRSIRGGGLKLVQPPPE